MNSRDRGIRVNVISPGPIDTSGITELVGEDNATEFKASQIRERADASDERHR